MAAVMSRSSVSHRRGAALPASHHRDVVGRPAAVRNAASSCVAHLASGVRQNLILSKLSMPLVLQPSAPSSSLFCAGRGHDRHRAEPCSDVALHLRTDRPLEPLVGAVRMLGVRVHHRRVRPPGRALGRHGARDRLLVRDQRVDLERPRAGCDHALVRHVLHLHVRVVPVALDRADAARAARRAPRRIAAR